MEAVLIEEVEDGDELKVAAGVQDEAEGVNQDPASFKKTSILPYRCTLMVCEISQSGIDTVFHCLQQHLQSHFHRDLLLAEGEVRHLKEDEDEVVLALQGDNSLIRMQAPAHHIEVVGEAGVEVENLTLLVDAEDTLRELVHPREVVGVQ